MGDGQRREILENLVIKEGLKDNVKFLGIRSDVPSVLKSSDIVILSSHWEGFGLAAVEGMAAGKPLIASNVDGLAQIVSESGLLFEKGDFIQLSTYIKLLIEDKDLYEEYVQKSLKRSEDFDIRNMLSLYLNVYKDICQKLLY